MPRRRFAILSAVVVSSIMLSLNCAALEAPVHHAQKDDVRRLIDRYFQTWSAQDMERYGQCFMPQAAIQLIDANGQLITMPLAPFLQSQREAHRRSTNRMVETPERVEIRFDARLAHALVYWKLVDGERTEYGYDHFTLMQSEGKWRIVNLIFYTTPAPSESESPNGAAVNSQGRKPLVGEGTDSKAPSGRQ